MSFRISVVAAALSAYINAGVALAEIYQGIGPLHTVSDLRKQFPGATFTDMKPAWAQQDEKLYSITGAGMSGTIVVLMYDGNIKAEEVLRHSAEIRGVEPRPYVPSDEFIGVLWVRWVPASPIPISRVVTKYGPPDTSGFSDEDLTPYKKWSKRGLEAYLTDDGKYANRFDFNFTDKERRDAFIAKWGREPDFSVKAPTQ